jgi:16S rRNA (adenine1518-N6/adenine1519-N6)-dimethyltransferase
MQPKKSLGQNFLRDQEVLEKIISAADLEASENVMEIGPGEGVLTQELVKSAGKVIAIEKDDNLAEKLKAKYKNNPKLEIINGDILEVNLPEIFEKNNFQKYKVIANIPYYITSLILRLFLETTYPPKEMILMVQKEVAQRISAQPGQMSILAVGVQYYAQVEILFNVDRKSFYPIPEVDSAVIRIKNIKNDTASKEETKIFFRFVRAGFSAKRKTLLNNLSTSLHLERGEVEERLKKAEIDPVQRAQELSVEDWKKIVNVFTEKLFLLK